MHATHEHSNATVPPQSSRHNGSAVALVLFLIIYGSLYPFVWNFEQPQDFIWIAPFGLIDAVENIVLFIPLGAILAWRYHAQEQHGIHFLIWLIIALVVAAGLQWLQIYLPRTPALMDIVFNMIGHILGWGGGLRLKARVQDLLQQHQQVAQLDRFALLLLVFWLITELFPLIPTFDVSTVWHNVKSLWEQDIWQPRRMGLHIGTTILGLGALAQVLRSLGLDNWTWPLALPTTLIILLGKFIVIGQAPGGAVVLGIVLGLVIWAVMDCASENGRWTALMSIATATYLLDAIWPWQWRAVPMDMVWLPFASSLSSSITGVVSARAFEFLCFGALLWSAVRNGGLLTGLTIFAALVVFLCEWLQCYLPTRTPEMTSPFLVIIVAWLLAALSPKPPRKHRSRRKTRRAAASAGT